MGLNSKLVGVGALLVTVTAGCSVLENGITDPFVNQKFHVTTGYAKCPSCSKTVTYTSSLASKINRHVQDDRLQQNGWVTAEIRLLSTNLRDPYSARIPGENLNFHEFHYKIEMDYTNTGNFKTLMDLYLVDGDKDIFLRQDNADMQVKCFNNVSSGCYWSQTYYLPARYVEAALRSGNGLRFLAAHSILRKVNANDGYEDKSYKSVFHVGAAGEIPFAALSGFTGNLQDRHAVLPSSKVELAELRQLVAAEKRYAEVMQTQEKKTELRDRKQKKGAQLCRQLDNGLYAIGYTEAHEDQKIKINLVSNTSSDTQLSLKALGHFSQTSIWDDPDKWMLCE